MEYTIPIPDDVAKKVQDRWEDIPGRVLESFALAAYNDGIITEYEIQKILNISSRWELEEFLKKNKVYLYYTEEDLEQDIKNLEKVV
ncbi:conserved hypothetical protein [Desulfonatronospira thiodismutans ASO3-1]|uniref:Uncharacterized protein n=1 Tax=Desulfonatronospira thiodismutans ASO3-1 TaxID=555779 RepID=D6STZ7_9BACT|nr:UPF0175 family protein [Desulfonatronospira thiodismutans]EFI34163.1 conserved hypothetical protein [Desulfonatronospira thiodismutans ASO3-1]